MNATFPNTAGVTRKRAGGLGVALVAAAIFVAGNLAAAAGVDLRDLWPSGQSQTTVAPSAISAETPQTLEFIYYIVESVEQARLIEMAHGQSASEVASSGGTDGAIGIGVIVADTQEGMRTAEHLLSAHSEVGEHVRIVDLRGQ